MCEAPEQGQACTAHPHGPSQGSQSIGYRTCPALTTRVLLLVQVGAWAQSVKGLIHQREIRRTVSLLLSWNSGHH